jgi:hypothetical protein
LSNRAAEDRSAMQWLVADWHLLGLTGQNWILVVGGALTLYIAGLVIAQRRRRHRR